MKLSKKTMLFGKTRKVLIWFLRVQGIKNLSLGVFKESMLMRGEQKNQETEKKIIEKIVSKKKTD